MTAWLITAHAVDRYRQRLAPDLTTPQARRWLETHAPAAAPLRRTTETGQALYLLPGDVVLVAKPDPHLRRMVAVTVGWWDKGHPDALVVDDEPADLAAVAAVPGLLARGTPDPPPLPPAPTLAELQADLAEARRHVSELRSEVGSLRSRNSQITSTLAGLQQALDVARARDRAAGRLLRLAREMASLPHVLAAMPQGMRDRVAHWARQAPDHPDPDDGAPAP